MVQSRDISNVFELWFNKINLYNVYNFQDFTICKNEIQDYVNNVNHNNTETSVIQESILEIIRENLMIFGIDDIYHIFLEHLIIKNILQLTPSPNNFRDILTERIEIIKEMYIELPMIWLNKNNHMLSLFREDF